MAYKDVLVPVIALAEDEAALTAAGEIAAQFAAKPVALIVSVSLGSAFHDQPEPLSAVLRDIAKGSASHAGQERQRIVEWLKHAPHDFDLRDLTIEGAVLQDEIVAHARLADLVVTVHAEGHGRARQALLEDVLFKSGRPALIVPQRAHERAWKRILIGWNAKAEAVRAVIGAMPMLQAADAVVVATVDAVPTAAGHAQGPGRDLAAHLARHGVRAEVRNLDSMGRTDAKALYDEALAVDADLIVLGAYGHSRAQELVFGGVTRELLTRSPIPLFMAH